MKTFTGTATVSIKDRDWRVIGLFDGGNGFTNAQVFLTFDAMADAFGAKGVSRVVVRAPSAVRAAETADALRARLAGKADVVTNRPAVALAQATLAGIGGGGAEINQTPITPARVQAALAQMDRVQGLSLFSKHLILFRKSRILNDFPLISPFRRRL